ncbi:MAG: hypothetical protein A3G87_09765 [Omnitrophica bacterium RIFCSPLOWO2_12_FULL_50_11]|nr:MAG: hypothetical protein A3G87_09765 [Omnitrophica bacterium RIFCSPLOWO2_12_FULL_50_11]
MRKKVLVILAPGCEEIEAVAIIDVLRRAEMNVTVAGLGGTDINGAHGIRFRTDIALDDYDKSPDAVILPGGMPGSRNLGQSKKVTEILQKAGRANKLIGAICAAPALALAPAGILDGKKATCYPGFEQNFAKSVTFSEDRVVVDGNVITSRGPGSALEFALELVDRLAGSEKARELRSALLVIPAGTRV